MKIKNTFVVAFLSALFLLTGCSSGLDDASPIDYQPGELSGTANWQNFATDMAACLKESGWEVEVSPRNSFSITITDDSMSAAWEAANVECKQSLGYDQEPEPLTEVQMKRLYQGKLSLVACLANEGYQVQEIPSEQAFLDDAIFDPYGELYYPTNPNKISEDTYAKLIKICPEP